MKYALALLLAAATSAPALADQYVNGYVRQDGTYVAPHMRSSPNSTQSDNYSTQGNTNPYTGERGTRRDTTYDNPYQPRQRDRDDD